MQQRKKHRGILLLTAAVCFLLSWLLVQKLSVYRLSNVYEVRCDQGHLYGIDVQEQNYCIFLIDLATGESRRIKVPITSGGGTNSLSNLTYCSSGDVYVVQSFTEEGRTENWIKRCDFDKNRLEDGWNLEEFSDKNLVMMTEDQNMLRLIYVDRNSYMENYLMKNNAWELAERFQVTEDTYIAEFTRDGGTYLFQLYGGIYRVDEEGNSELVYDTSAGESGSWKTNFRFFKDEFYFEDGLTKKTYRVDVTKPPYEAVPCENTYRPAQSFDEQRMSLLGFDGKGTKYGVYSMDDGRQTAAVCGEYEYVADELEWSLRDKITVWLIGSALLSGTSGILWYGWRLLCRKEIVIPLIVEAALLTFLLMGGGIWLLRDQVLSAIRRNAAASTLETCIQLGYETMDTYILENIQVMCGLDKIAADNQLPYRVDYSQYDVLEVKGISENSALKALGNAEYNLYFEKDGMIYPVGESVYILNTPVEYNLVGSSYFACDAMKRALKEDQVMTLEYAGLTGQQYAAFIPFDNSGGEYPLLLEVTMMLKEGNMSFAQQALSIEKVVYLISGILLVVILFILWMGMRPLGILKQAALLVEKGKLGAEAKAKGRSEAAVTAVRFNHMSRQMEDQISGISRFQKKYAAFIPLDFLEAAGNDRSGEKDREVRQKQYMVMTVGSRQSSGESASERNAALSSQIERIHEENGEVIAFEHVGIQCLFLGEMEHALKAAVNILQDADEDAREDLCISISYDEIRLGVTGDELRSAVSAFSINGDFNGFLRLCAEKYQASLLVTGSAADRIPGFFDRYHCRRLGTCYLEMVKKTERIYEVLDGEPKDQKRKKLLTADEFEEGLSFFEAGEYRSARTSFIRILSENGKDAAALHYIRLCEKNLDCRENERQTYMEIY